MLLKISLWVKTNNKIKQKQQQQQTLITSKIYVRFKEQNLMTKPKEGQIKLKLNKITSNCQKRYETSP